MNLQTICCILNFVGLIAVIICIVVLFSKINKNNEDFANDPSYKNMLPTRKWLQSKIMMSDDNGNLTKDDTNVLQTYIDTADQDMDGRIQQLDAAISQLKSQLQSQLTTLSSQAIKYEDRFLISSDGTGVPGINGAAFNDTLMFNVQGLLGSTKALGADPAYGSPQYFRASKIKT